MRPRRSGAPRPASALVGALLAALVVGCGAADLLVYEGETGTPVPMQLIDGISGVDVTFAGSERAPLLIDTGSPITMFSQHAFVGENQRSIEGRLEGLGPVFPQFQAPLVPLFSPDNPCAGPVPLGLLGADLMRHFRVQLDYEREQFTLADGDPDDLDGGADGAAQQLSFELRGGGRLEIDGYARSVGATRIVIGVQVEGQVATALVDTGATTTLIDEAFFAELEQEGRPQRCCVGLDGLALQTVRVPLSRVRRLQLGTVKADSLAVLVLPTDLLFEQISREVGRDVRMIIGGNFLRRFRHELDYRRGSWRLWGGGAAALASEYTLPGFSYCRSRGDPTELVVRDVYEQTDASAQGVRPGDRVVEVAGRDVAQLEDGDLSQLLGTASQTPVALRFRHSEVELVRQLRVQDLLPPY